MKLSVILILLSVGLRSQTIKIVDIVTQEPLPGVLAYSPDKNSVASSNSKGEINLSGFKDTDSIYFSSIGYEKVLYTKIALAAARYKVGLRETNIPLNEIIVSANRWEESKIETPNRINKIKKKEVEFRNPQTTADVLETSGYAYIQKSQMAGGSPSLRGFATNRVMLVVDGVRMNNAIFRSGNLQNVISIDANALENAEILFGPGAVMYGSDAIGGVMDFHTLRPAFADSSGKIIFSSNAFGRYSSANTEKTGHADFNIAGKKWSFVTSATFTDYDDLRAGTQGNPYYLRPSYVHTFEGKDSVIVNTDSSLQVGSAFGQMNLMQKIHFKPNNKWRLAYDFHYSATTNAPRYDRLTLDLNGDRKPDNAVWYYGPQKWMMNRIEVKNNRSSGFYDQLRVIAAVQNYEESRHDRRFNNNLLRHQTEKVVAYSLNADLDKKLSDKIFLFYGTEALYNLVGSSAYRQNIITGEEFKSASRYPNGSSWQAYGAYVNFKFKLDSKLILNTGARYSHYSIKADFDTTLFPFPFTKAFNSNGAVNGNAGLVFTPNITWQIYLNLSSGFRAPNIDDLGKVFESQPGFVVVPNADLKPEYAYNLELGMAKSFRNFFKVDAAAYYTILNNALARRGFQYNQSDSLLYDGQMSRVLAIQNITRAYVYGLQAGLEINFGYGIGLKGTISYQKGEEQSEDSLIYYPKPHVPPLFGKAELTYTRKKLKLDFYMQYNGKMDFTDLPLAERTDHSVYAKTADGLPFVPAWYTLNFKVAFYFNKNISLNGGVENITDRLYRTYSSGISAPGRNLILSLRYKM